VCVCVCALFATVCSKLVHNIKTIKMDHPVV